MVTLEKAREIFGQVLLTLKEFGMVNFAVILAGVGSVNWQVVHASSGDFLELKGRAFLALKKRPFSKETQAFFNRNILSLPCLFGIPIFSLPETIGIP